MNFQSELWEVWFRQIQENCQVIISFHPKLWININFSIGKEITVSVLTITHVLSMTKHPQWTYRAQLFNTICTFNFSVSELDFLHPIKYWHCNVWVLRHQGEEPQWRGGQHGQVQGQGGPHWEHSLLMRHNCQRLYANEWTLR